MLNNSNGQLQHLSLCLISKRKMENFLDVNVKEIQSFKNYLFSFN